jgi:hypothetical protein
MDQEIRKGTNKFEKLLFAKNKLIECIGEISKYPGGIAARPGMQHEQVCYV